MESTSRREKRELYNLRADPGERHNVLARHPDVERKLFAQLIDIVTSGSTRPAVESTNDTPPWEGLVWLPK